MDNDESVLFRKLTRTQNGEVYALLKTNLEKHGDGTVSYKNDWSDQRIADFVNELEPDLPPVKANSVADFRNAAFGKLSAAGRPPKKVEAGGSELEVRLDELAAIVQGQGEAIAAHSREVNLRLISLEKGMAGLDGKLHRLIDRLGRLAIG